VIYTVLSLVYNWYLVISEDFSYYPDFITHLVALQTEKLLNIIGYESNVLPHSTEPSMKLIIRGKYLARVIEGCNSVSVIILFVSFIIAFSGKLKTTIIYLFIGSVMIYFVNLFRIIILSIGLFHYPWRSEILHSVVFPAIIYGMVFLLWILWVNRFSNLTYKHECLS